VVEFAVCGELFELLGGVFEVFVLEVRGVVFGGFPDVFYWVVVGGVGRHGYEARFFEDPAGG
jgi:hypothetical protein